MSPLAALALSAVMTNPVVVKTRPSVVVAPSRVRYIVGEPNTDVIQAIVKEAVREALRAQGATPQAESRPDLVQRICQSCHQSRPGTPQFTGRLSLEQVEKAQIAILSGTMPPNRKLNDAQQNALSRAFINRRLQKGQQWQSTPPSQSQSQPSSSAPSPPPTPKPDDGDEEAVPMETVTPNQPTSTANPPTGNPVANWQTTNPAPVRLLLGSASGDDPS